MKPASPRARIALTKLERQSAAGLELIGICHAVTADGSLSADEIADLKAWVAAYRGSGLPAAGHIHAVLERILADGVITDAERRDLYLALEKVLPPDLRSDVSARRKEGEAFNRARNAPIDGWDFMVAGCRYEGRPAIIEESCRPGDQVFLRRDPRNPHSRNAIEVVLRTGEQIGYVPEIDARDMATLLDNGKPYVGRVKKVLGGGRSPIPVVVADFFDESATVDGLSKPSVAPTKVQSRTGCSIMLVGGSLVAGAGIATRWLA